MVVRNRRAQSLSDYALALGVVAAMMATMQTFIQRYVQAKIKDTTDDVLAISESDVVDTNGNLLSRAERGMKTQRAGTDVRKPNAGFIDPNTGQPTLVADVTSSTASLLVENVTNGRRYASGYLSGSGTPPNQRLYFKGKHQLPGDLATKTQAWFLTDEQKAKRWEKLHQRKARERQRERQREQEEQLRQRLWSDAKSAAHACYASRQCRKLYEDPAKWRKFANRWNRLQGKNSPYRLDPNDPTGGFEKVYGVALKDAASGWSDPAYEKPPDWWGQTDRDDGLWKDRRAVQYPLFLLQAYGEAPGT